MLTPSGTSNVTASQHVVHLVHFERLVSRAHRSAAGGVTLVLCFVLLQGRSQQLFELHFDIAARCSFNPATPCWPHPPHTNMALLLLELLARGSRWKQSRSVFCTWPSALSAPPGCHAARYHRRLSEAAAPSANGPAAAAQRCRRLEQGAAGAGASCVASPPAVQRHGARALPVQAQAHAAMTRAPRAAGADASSCH
jgi:hypothetical protein